MRFFLKKKKLRSQEIFWGSGRPNGPDKFHLLHVHFECASNEIHISSTILRCRWWNWNFSSTTAALYSWLVTLSGPRSSILASYRETSVQPRQPWQPPTGAVTPLSSTTSPDHWEYVVWSSQMYNLIIKNILANDQDCMPRSSKICILECQNAFWSRVSPR